MNRWGCLKNSSQLSVVSYQLKKIVSEVRGTFIVDPIITYTLTSLCELVNVRLAEAQETNGFLCYKCKLIFPIYYKRVSLNENLPR